MISANNNFGNNVGNAQQSEKRNWKIGKMYGKNPNDPSKLAVLEIGLYKSEYAIFGTLAVRYEMGKDSKGRAQFETGLNKENPSVMLNAESVATILTLFRTIKQKDIPTIKFYHDTGKSKLDIVGSETNTVFTVTNNLGSKSIQFDATPAGPMNIHGAPFTLLSFLEIIFKKQCSTKLDPDEFATPNEDSPF